MVTRTALCRCDLCGLSAPVTMMHADLAPQCRRNDEAGNRCLGHMRRVVRTDAAEASPLYSPTIAGPRQGALVNYVCPLCFARSRCNCRGRDGRGAGSAWRSGCRLWMCGSGGPQDTRAHVPVLGIADEALCFQVVSLGQTDGGGGG